MTTHSKITIQDLVEVLKKKDPKEELTITDIVSGGYMPWAKHHRTILKLIQTDSENQNILKVRETDQGYYIQSRNLIRYIILYGPALMGMIRIKKSNGKVKGGKDNNRKTKRSK